MLTSHPVHLFPKETLPTEPKKGAPAPHLRELDPPDLRFPAPWRRSSLHHRSSPHPLLPCQRLLFLPAFSILVSGTTILSVTNSARHKRNSWAGPSSPGHGSLGPGWVQSSPPSPSVQERSPSLLPFAVSLSRPSSASCLESSLQNSLHFRRWPPLENTDPRAPRGVVRPRSQGPSCCPFCAHRAPCWTLSTLQGTLLGAPRRCREPCATGIGALRPS